MNKDLKKVTQVAKETVGPILKVVVVNGIVLGGGTMVKSWWQNKEREIVKDGLEIIAQSGRKISNEIRRKKGKMW